MGWGSCLLAAEKIGPSFGLPGHPPCWRTQYGDVPLRAGPSAGGLPGLTWIRFLRHDPHVGPLRCLTSSWNASWTPVPEILFTTFQRSRLYAEFRVQMRETHGSHWLEQLKVLRTTMRLSCGKGPNGHTGGFQKKKNTSNKSESGFIGSSSCRPAHTSAATELLRDAVAGMSFLSKMGNSSWWNWLLVSTLALAGGRTTSSISGRDGPLLSIGTRSL